MSVEDSDSADVNGRMSASSTGQRQPTSTADELAPVSVHSSSATSVNSQSGSHLLLTYVVLNSVNVA